MWRYIKRLTLLNKTNVIFGFSTSKLSSFETGHFWPVKMARLAEVCMGHKWPALQPNSKQALPRLAATLPHMTRLWPAFILRHGPLLARLVFSNEKAWS